MMKLKLIAAITIVFCLLLPYSIGASANALDEGAAQRQVQAFDVAAGKVIKSVPNSKEYQKFAKTWLSSVTGLAPQLTSDDKCGYVFRIPLDEPTTVKAGATTINTSDVFLFYCPGKPQLLLVFDENRKPYLLQFTADIKPFLKAIDIQ